MLSLLLDICGGTFYLPPSILWSHSLILWLMPHLLHRVTCRSALATDSRISPQSACIVLIIQKVFLYKFTFLLSSCTEIFRFVMLPLVKCLQCVWTSKGLYYVVCRLNGSQAMKCCQITEQFRFIWCQCRLVCVPYSWGVVLERIWNTGWAYWGRWFRFGHVLCSFMPLHSFEVLCWSGMKM